MKAGTFLVWLHVTANIFWVGAIAAVALIVMAARFDAKLRGELASAIYQRLAAPAFVVSFVAGAARLFSDTGYYFKQTHFMHAKLLFAVIVIALHHVIGARAKKLARAEATDAGPTGALLVALAVFAAAATFTVIFRLPP
jgi:putative membrane protein